jgi:hypothetical protein
VQEVESITAILFENDEYENPVKSALTPLILAGESKSILYYTWLKPPSLVERMDVLREAVINRIYPSVAHLQVGIDTLSMILALTVALP